jgi:hypothetical protein
MLPYCPLRYRMFLTTLGRSPPFPPIIPVFGLFPGYYPLNDTSDAALIRGIPEHRDRGWIGGLDSGDTVATEMKINQFVQGHGRTYCSFISAGT